ncbi:MAG: DUF3108 domain-containing protein [Bacteroidales bacterium]|nr:DUF3108 domain-containing protein [Bacteroidales bacterium]
MKRFFLSLALLLGLVPGASFLSLRAQDARTRAFLDGDEHLTYSIRHNLFPGNIGTMTFTGKDGGSEYHVDAVLHASVAGVYKLDCEYGSTFRKDADLTPVSANRSQVEKKYWAKGFYNWSAPGSVHLDVTKSSRPPRNEDLLWSGTVRDLLGMIWWLRTLDYSKTSLGAGNNALLLDHDALPVNVASYTKGTYKYKGQQLPVIEVVLSQQGKEALRLTISDDPGRKLLKYSIALSFGTIRGTLK